MARDNTKVGVLGSLWLSRSSQREEKSNRSLSQRSLRHFDPYAETNNRSRSVLGQTRAETCARPSVMDLGVVAAEAALCFDRGRDAVPTCGLANPEGFRFCGACGATLTRSCPSCGLRVRRPSSSQTSGGRCRRRRSARTLRGEGKSGGCGTGRAALGTG